MKNFIQEDNLPWTRIVVQKFGCQNRETALYIAAQMKRNKTKIFISDNENNFCSDFHSKLIVVNVTKWIKEMSAYGLIPIFYPRVGFYFVCFPE